MISDKILTSPVVQDLGRIEYSAALELQERAVQDLQSGTGSEIIFLLEHEPVYTIGRTRNQSSLQHSSPSPDLLTENLKLKTENSLPHPTVETNRGGQATYHGPGQLVGYPVLDLNRRGRDLHRYLRFLEDVLIQVCADFGIEATRRDGLTGVWIAHRKIASLGVGVRKWITMHGFALNVRNECLPAFQHITPCGIAGVEMTCLEKETGLEIQMDEIRRRVAEKFTMQTKGGRVPSPGLKSDTPRPGATALP